MLFRSVSKNDFLLCSSQILERKVATGTVSYDEVGKKGNGGEIVISLALIYRYQLFSICSVAGIDGRERNVLSPLSFSFSRSHMNSLATASIMWSSSTFLLFSGLQVASRDNICEATLMLALLLWIIR